MTPQEKAVSRGEEVCVTPIQVPTKNSNPPVLQRKKKRPKRTNKRKRVEEDRVAKRQKVGKMIGKDIKQSKETENSTRLPC